MIYKLYNFSSKEVEIKSLSPEFSDPLVMPSVQLEDKNGKEIFLYDVLLDDEGEGWVVYFHEKGYVCLNRIGSTYGEDPVPVMDKLGNFGNHYYSLPMEIVGNKYINKIEDSAAIPNHCKSRFKKYIESIKNSRSL